MSSEIISWHQILVLTAAHHF